MLDILDIELALERHHQNRELLIKGKKEGTLENIREHMVSYGKLWGTSDNFVYANDTHMSMLIKLIKDNGVKETVDIIETLENSPFYTEWEYEELLSASDEEDINYIKEITYEVKGFYFICEFKRKEN